MENLVSVVSKKYYLLIIENCYYSYLFLSSRCKIRNNRNTFARVTIRWFNGVVCRSNARFGAQEASRDEIRQCESVTGAKSCKKSATGRHTQVW